MYVPINTLHDSPSGCPPSGGEHRSGFLHLHQNPSFLHPLGLHPSCMCGPSARGPEMSLHFVNRGVRAYTCVCVLNLCHRRIGCNYISPSPILPYRNPAIPDSASQSGVRRCHYASQVLCWVAVVDDPKVSPGSLVSKERKHFLAHTENFAPRNGQELIFLCSVRAWNEEETVQLTHFVHHRVVTGAVIDGPQEHKSRARLHL
jgi:hypothetical protein